MDDLISRQAAIDIVLEYARRLYEPVGTPEDNEMYSYGRGLLLSIERNLKQLPSAQPEIVRCKDCAKREYCRTSTVWAVAPPDDWFCADAERREHEQEKTSV